MQTLRWYRITVIKFMSIRLCCVFYFVSFQTKHGFDIRTGPVSFNLTSLEKDTPLVQVGFRKVPFFSIRCSNKSASELGIIQKTKKKTKIKLMLTINCLTKAYEN